MFIRRAALEYLIQRSENQQQQIDRLSEMVGILAKSAGQQFALDFGKDWNIQSTGDNLINADQQEARSSDWSF
ncbi:MAG TPA: hypothetical protein VHV54_27225 [Candidatus Binatia bacterium]|nr:hypothetical protein [Candidatus Binatia bacterium]